jgi:hypothetical protein
MISVKTMRDNVNAVFRQTREDIEQLSLPVARVWLGATNLMAIINAKYQKKKNDRKTK